MTYKSLNRPYIKKLDCSCSNLTYRPKTSRKYGVYKVYEIGYCKKKELIIEKLKLICISCGKEKTFKLEK